MKINCSSLFGIILIAEIVGSTAFAQAIGFADCNLEGNLAVIATNNPDANIGYPPSDQSGESSEIQPTKQRIPTWLITAIFFTICILIMGAALRKHKCCCGRKKFP